MNTDWFKEAQYGLFVHYMSELQNLTPFNPKEFDRGLHQDQVTDWNTCVNAFNVNLFAEQASQAGAAYVMFTLGQCSGYFCAPNSIYDAYTGHAAGEKCSERDLILDLHEALEAKGIKLMLYLIAHSPYGDQEASVALGSPELAANGYHYLPTPVFRDRWSEVIKEWSDRYGSKIVGWWFDGYYSDLYYNDVYCMTLSKAAKSGNSDSIVAFNPGLVIVKATIADDYTAGEQAVMELFPEDRWVDGIQWHCLTFLGDFWAYTNNKLPDEEVVQYVKNCTDKQGVVTLDVGVYRDGSISPEQMGFLKNLKEAIRG
ncbi:hypothetical protein EHS13_24145 [Paenibacillus psychroresistens]|uniref:alpha-L-fucosidase n=1 Tax=Paenibacillus psychroresistens TaxID=1778678 RepID=A0A6B8RPI7_9BACL|nr:alpha-L-fucosidase [Paenibacillus psychroresistens]QGQ97757.1 hypothetical protein EHS13_24145 [Paenibacillus psychroresistens]